MADLSPEKSKKKEEKDYLIDTIKFYSKYKGNEIKEFVDQQLKTIDNQKKFIINKPTWLIKVIDEGNFRIRSNVVLGFIIIGTAGGAVNMLIQLFHKDISSATKIIITQLKNDSEGYMYKMHAIKIT